MKGRELVHILKQDGWEIVRVKGSHYVMRKGNQTEVIPVHNTDIPKGLLHSILKRTGLK